MKSESTSPPPINTGSSVEATLASSAVPNSPSSATSSALATSPRDYVGGIGNSDNSNSSNNNRSLVPSTTLANSLITTAAISTIGAALIAAISSFWIATRQFNYSQQLQQQQELQRKQQRESNKNDETSVTTSLLKHLGKIVDRLDELERGSGRIDYDDDDDDDDEGVGIDANATRPEGKSPRIKNLNHGDSDNDNNRGEREGDGGLYSRRSSRSSARGKGLSRSLNAGAQFRDAYQEDDLDINEIHRNNHSQQQQLQKSKRHKSKSSHPVIDTSDTNQNVIPYQNDDGIHDDISYSPNAPPQTILTREPRDSDGILPTLSSKNMDSLRRPSTSHPHHNHNQHHNTNGNNNNIIQNRRRHSNEDTTHSQTTTTSSNSSHPHNEPVPIILISDPGQDLDDEMMFIMARHLVSLDLISLRGIVANLSPSFARARLTRGTLDLLGLHRVPVGIGTDGGDVAGKHSSDQFEHTASSYIVQGDGEAARGLESGMRLLQRLYDEAEDVEYVEVWEDEFEVEENDHHHRGGKSRTHGNAGEVVPGVEIKKMKRKSSTGSGGGAVIVNGNDTHDTMMNGDVKKPERKMKRVAKGGLVLVITSSLKDAAIFVRDNPSLFAAKTREVVVMGGCKPVPMGDDTAAAAAIAASSLDDAQSQHTFNTTSTHSESIHAKLAKYECEPDSAHNNTFDTAASAFFYSQCQKMNVTFTVVSRFAAYAAKMPRSVYDDLALTGSSIGWRLRNSQRASIDQLWQRACSKDPAVRKGLPPRCDRKWFIDTFCGGDDDEARCCEDTAWDLVTGFMQYDTIALLAAIPQVREKYFDPMVLPPLKLEKKKGSNLGNRSKSASANARHGEGIQNLANEIERMSDAVTDRILFTRSRRSSDPGPGYLERALAQANIDNRKPESTLHNISLPIDFPTSRVPVAFERGTRNLIGISDKEHNLKDPKSLIRLLETGYRAGILCNHHTQPHLILCLQLRWDNLADTLLTCLMLRSLWDMRLASVLGVVVSIYPSEADSSKDGDDAANLSDHEDDKTTKTSGHTGRRSSATSNASTDASPDPSPSTLRALAESIRETLRSIGLSHVRFLIVSGNTMEEHKAKAAEALLELYEAAPPIGVTLVLTATFTSVWPFAESYPELFRDKTVRVVHTGGALVWPARWGWGSLPFSPSFDDHTDSSGDLSDELTEEKILVPDPAAQNHRLDLPSARLFYKRAQALSVPLVILSRHVAKECCIPRNFFDVLGSHGGLVGKRICDSERNSLLNLWRCACAPMGSAARGNLPERCDAHWFAETFCAGREARNEDDVWNSVEAVNLYSPIALLAALPGETVKNYFQTMPFTVRSATHHVVGLTEEVPPRNVRNPSELRSLVVQSLLSAALANESEFTKEAPPKVAIRMIHEQRRRVYNSRDSVLGNSVHSYISTESNNMEDDDMWTFSEKARRELFSRTVVRTSKNLVMPKETKRTFVSLSDNRDVIGFIPPQGPSNEDDVSSDEDGSHEEEN